MIEISGRIPVRIQPFFWIVILLLGFLNSQTFFEILIWAMVMTISVLVHEFGHALSAVFFGQNAEIELIGFGGVTRRDGPALKLWQEFIIVLNGPLAGFSLAVLAYLLGQVIITPQSSPNLLLYILEVFFQVNVLWTILNLLPVLPLDGAHLTRITFQSLFGFKGIRYATLVSLILGVILSVVAILLQFIILGAFLMMMSFESYQAWKVMGGMTETDTDLSCQEILKEGEQALQLGHEEKALQIFHSLRESVHKGIIYITATQLASHIYASQGRFQEAFDLLVPIKKSLAPDYLFLLAQTAFRLHRWKDAIHWGEEVFQDAPSSEMALMCSLSYAALGEAKSSIGWLNAAIQAGLENISSAIQKEEFDCIRLTAEFQAFLQTIHH